MKVKMSAASPAISPSKNGAANQRLCKMIILKARPMRFIGVFPVRLDRVAICLDRISS